MLIERAPSPVHCLLVDAAAITDLDYSAGRAVIDLCADLTERGVKVIFGRVNRYLLSDMDRHGITPVIGRANIFPTLHEALAAVRPDLGSRSDV